MPAEFSTAISTNGQWTIVRLAGELDIVTSVELRHDLETVHGPVVFDLEHLDFMDAAGIAAIVDTARRNGRVTLTHPSPWLRRVLEVSDLTSWILDCQGAAGPRRSVSTDSP